MQWWSYGVQVRGIKKRCRNPDLHIESDLSRDEKPCEEKAKALAKDWIEKNMKEVERAAATITYWTSSEKGISTWEPLNKAHNLRFYL